MPKGAHYKVRWVSHAKNYQVQVDQEEIALLFQDEVSWFEWVGEHNSFAFYGRNGHLNLLKERRARGGGGYWYAYQRQKSGMTKRYIGTDKQVRWEKLEEIAAQLSSAGTTKNVRRDYIKKSNTISTPSGSQLQFEPLLMSKLQLPRPQKSLLPRPHLIKLLDTGLERKLTHIAGPAGYGKTTLINQWITAHLSDVTFPAIACVTLDEEDNDVMRFWHYLIAACQQLNSKIGKEAMGLLLAHRRPPFKPLIMMLTAFLNELSQLEHSGILILDDCHVIQSPQVIETLQFFIEHLPSELHLVMLIRGDLPFSLSRLRASNEILEIHPPDLCFSLEETRLFLEGELSYTLSPKLLRQIDERLDGWPAGLRLLTHEMNWSTNVQGIENMLQAFGRKNWSIQEYFRHEVLNTLSEEQQKFVLQTTILPRITAPLCDTILKRTDSVLQLEKLRSSDLFLVPLDGIAEWSRYHLLFAEVMQQEAHLRLGEEMLCQLAIQASLWYEEHKMLAEAIETALFARAFPRASRLIRQLIDCKQQRNTPSLSEQSTLKRWLDALPEEELEHNPDLCVHYAMALLAMLMEEPGHPEGRKHIHQLLEMAELRWRDANNTAKLAEVFAFRALLARQEGKFLQAVTWAKQSLAWLPEEDKIWRTLNLTVVGGGEILDGQLSHAHRLLLEALKLCEQQGNVIYARATRNMLTWALFEQGEFYQAAEQYRHVLAEAIIQKDQDDIAHTQLGLAHILYEWNNLNEAEKATSEVLEIGVQMNVPEFQVRAIIRLAMIENAQGQIMQAQQRLMTLLTSLQTPGSPHDYQLLREAQATLAHLQLSNGNLTAVQRWSTGIEESEETLPLLQQRREHLLQMRFLLAQKTYIPVIERLENLATIVLTSGHLYLLRQIQVMLTLAYAHQGWQIKARKQLYELLSTAYSEGHMRLFLDEREEMANLLLEIMPYIQENTLRLYVQRILDAFALETAQAVPKAIAKSSFLPEPLSPQEQKVLRLLAAGNANAAIASELVVSINTVRTQIQSIYRKLNVNNRVEASFIARQLELI